MKLHEIVRDYNLDHLYAIINMADAIKRRNDISEEFKMELEALSNEADVEAGKILDDML